MRYGCINKCEFALLILMLIVLRAAFAREVDAPYLQKEKIAEVEKIRSLLAGNERELDLAALKLSFDQILVPETDIDEGLSFVEKNVGKIKAMIPDGGSSQDRLEALKAYLYVPGPWNEYKAYQYDLDDPLGAKIGNKLLKTYLVSRKGNCVTMPILFAILAQRLGLDVVLTTAPEHLLVKYTDHQRNQTYNLETTSGANPARDVWIQQQTEIRDDALKNGIYLRKLSQRESAAVMANTVAEHFSVRREPEKLLALADVLLDVNSRDIAAMLWKGRAFALLLQRDFVARYPRPIDIPESRLEYFHYLSEQNRYWYAKAEALGWREPSKLNRQEYVQGIEVIKAKR